MRALLSFLLLIATLAVGTPARAEPDSLVIGIAQFPASLHPSIESMMARAYVLGLARRPFTTYDAAWTLTCMLCVSLPTLENGGAVMETTADGKPGMAVTFRIQPQARWSDGAPITVADVAFTLEVGRHPLSGVMPKEFYRSVLRLESDGERTFTLHFDRRTWDYNDIAGLELLPAHIEREAFADPPGYPTRTRYVTDPTNPGLYNGPYRVAEVVPGSHIVLVRNEYWWGDPPAFARIVVRAIENTAALEANLLSGTVQMIAGEVGLTLDQAIALEQRHGDRFRVLYKPGLIYENVSLNLDNPVLADKRVRQALLYAIDRPAITQQLFAGRLPVADTAVSPLDPMAAPDVHHYAFDAGRADALLREAGWLRQSDGTRMDASGRPLQLEIISTAGDRTRELVEQVLQSQWQRVGITVRIRNQPARVFFGETVSHRAFADMAMFAWIGAPQSVPRTTLHSDEIPTAANGWSGQNISGWRNRDVDALIAAIETELDETKRHALWGRLQAIYAEELPALPLFFRAQAFVLPSWLDGVEPTGHQYPTTLWVEHWHRRAP
ncbi:MAG: peptide ABC transporter substrate-binding protein [Rhodospirillales bacterium]|nr:peptide ABC transporter substrate-binding protein [Rhodospirillales bacterium]